MDGIDGRQRKTCRFVEEAPNGYGGLGFGREFTKCKGQGRC